MPGARSPRRHAADDPGGGRRGRAEPPSLLTAAAVSLILIGVGLCAVVLYGAAGPPQPPIHAVIPDSETAPPPVAVAPRDASRVLPRSRPVRIEIPSLKVKARILALGLRPDGTLEVPPLSQVMDAGWYKGGPSPGERGPAVVVGHVDSKSGPGVFYRLGSIEKGAKVIIKRADKKTVTFKVTHIEQVDKRRFPTSRVYGPIDYAGLRLITCGGSFDRASGHYRDNIIVYAELTR